MPEAVIVATARSPIGRAIQGLARRVPPRRPRRATSSTPCSTRCPQLDRHDVEDLILGCGQPAGESGYNMARVVAVLAGMADVPGVTVNRYCSSSLQTIRMAAHAIKAGEGDVFVAAGVETVSRFMSGMADGSGPHNPKFADAEARTAERAEGGGADWTPARRACPTSTSPWARPPRTSPSSRTSPARRWTSSPPCPSSGPPPRTRTGFFEREITPVDADADGNRRSSQGRRHPPRHHRREARRAQAGVPPRRHGHRRQRLPAQRRRRRRGRDERHPGRGARPHAARPDRVLAA